jgi:hypothetical protein
MPSSHASLLRLATTCSDRDVVILKLRISMICSQHEHQHNLILVSGTRQSETTKVHPPPVNLRPSASGEVGSRWG